MQARIRLSIGLILGITSITVMELSCTRKPPTVTSLRWDLMSSLKRSDLKWVGRVLKEHPELVHADNGAFSLIDKASMENNLPLARMLIQAGLDVNRVNPEGRTPLQEAARSDAPAIAQLLIENGAELDRVYRYDNPMIIPSPQFEHLPPHPGMSALDMAARDGCYSAARVLLDAGAKQDANLPTSSYPAIMRAVEGHYPPEQRYRYIETGRVTNLYVKGHITHQNVPIPRVPPGNTLVIDLLIEHGAELNPQTRTLYGSPLHHAIQHYQVDSIRHLLKAHGDKMNINDSFFPDPRSPLGYAIEMDPAVLGGTETERFQIIQMLVEHGAVVNTDRHPEIFSGHGFGSAADHAAKCGRSAEIVKYLRKAEAESKGF